MARKKIDLSTAKTADGASPSRKSVYDLCGIASTSYKHSNVASYGQMLRGMNLMELQDHAYTVGVFAGPDRDNLIDRLERKFILENSRFAAGIEQPTDASKTASAEVRAEAERIISRGR